MTKTYTVSEVLELQNKRKQLEERIAIHTTRAQSKQQELQEIFKRNNVNSIEELSTLCVNLNAQMQEFAQKEEQTLEQMRDYCDELDRLL